MLRQSRRGRLKLYIGFAAGVGKTYRMLEEAHALRKRGVGVVLGYIETHGRVETERLVDGLEAGAAPAHRVPRRRRRGDGSGGGDRAPPRHRRGRRDRAHQRAGQQEPAQVSGRDRAARRRDQRHRRLQHPAPREPQRPGREGDRGQRARDRARQLPQAGRSGREPGSGRRGSARAAQGRERSTLPTRSSGRWSTSSRTASWRRCASWRCARWRRAWSARATGTRRERGSPADSGHALGRVMVCMSSFPARAAALLRRGSRMAGRLNTDWFVVYVETPREAPHLIDSEAQRFLLANVEKARELGAEVVRLKSEDRGGRAARLRALARRRPHPARAHARAALAPAAGQVGRHAHHPRRRRLRRAPGLAGRGGQDVTLRRKLVAAQAAAGGRAGRSSASSPT